MTETNGSGKIWTDEPGGEFEIDVRAALQNGNQLILSGPQETAIQEKWSPNSHKSPGRRVWDVKCLRNGLVGYPAVLYVYRLRQTVVFTCRLGQPFVRYLQNVWKGHIA